MKAKLTDLIKLALDRAENLKGVKSTPPEDVIPNLPAVPESSFPDTENVQNNVPSSHSSPGECKRTFCLFMHFSITIVKLFY